MSHQALSRILLVEDEEDIQRVVRLSLEAIGGIAVEIVASGSDAVKIALHFKPQLILLDVMMPGLDGPSTLRSLRAEEALRAIPVVFLTARAQPQEVQEYFDLGAYEVIVKPFDPFELPQRLQELWSRHIDG